MADEDTVTPALETPASEPTETTELETVEVEGEELDEEDELEFGFKKYRVPKSLKDGVEALRADHTQKTQTVSARQKALDERESSLTQQAEVTEAELDAKAGLRNIAAQLKGFENWDYAEYQAAMDVNPIEAQKAWNYKTYLMHQKAELEGSLGKAAQERTEKAHQDLGKRVQETLAEAPKIIPGFKPEMIGKIADFATGEMGIPESFIRANWSPKLLKVFHLAQLGFELTKKAAAKPAGSTTPAPVLTTVRPNNPPPPTGLSDRLSTEEWAKRFRKKMAANNT